MSENKERFSFTYTLFDEDSEDPINFVNMGFTNEHLHVVLENFRQFLVATGFTYVNEITAKSNTGVKWTIGNKGSFRKDQSGNEEDLS